MGGTFTDLIAFGEDGPRIGKVPTAAPDPSVGVIQGVKDLGVSSPDAILHGSTVATNALLERKGARVGLVTTRGFGDVLEIGRQNRPRLYEIEPQKPAPLIPGELRFELTERTAADGTALVRPDPEELEQLARRLVAARVEAVAICFLHSYANPENERIAAAALKGAGLPRVSISAEVLPEFREFERTSTVAANAYLAEPVERYLHTLHRDAPGPLWIVQSNGGLLTTEETAQLPVRTVLSGPAGGVTGAIWSAGASGYSEIVTFDMGGTSTDVSLCPGGPLHTNSGVVGQVPISIDMIDIHTVGAGGGSIAWVDEGGALQVGPQSAGSEPGPACYGRGGFLPTVSDANLVLGRLPAGVRLGGRMELDHARAISAIQSLNEQLPGHDIEAVEIAAAVLDLANANMESALATYHHRTRFRSTRLCPGRIRRRRSVARLRTGRAPAHQVRTRSPAPGSAFGARCPGGGSCPVVFADGDAAGRSTLKGSVDRSRRATGRTRKEGSCLRWRPATGVWP